MNRELRELLDRINEKKAEVKRLVEENKLDAADAAKTELKDLQKKFDLMADLESELAPAQKEMQPAKEENAIQSFARAARTGFKAVSNQMTEGSQQDGGYTVPQDILTQINTYRESRDALQTLVRVEPVSTLSGSRVFKKRAQQTGFAKVAEGGKIAAMDTPQFEILEYKVDKYAGLFPLTNELLEDTDANITGALVDWIGNESRVTRNKLILAAIQTKEAVDLKDIDGFKTALNVTLDPAFRNTAVIVTNQDGFNYLDKLKDKDGDYLLQKNPLDPTTRMLFGVSVRVISNKDMPSDTTDAKAPKYPVIIGDLNEGVVLFERKALNIMTSNVAIDAFENDLTYYRALEREQVQLRDEEAFVNGFITETLGE